MKTLSLIFLCLLLALGGCKSSKNDPTIKLPIVGAATVSDITTAGAKAASRLTDAGAGVTGVSTIKEYGICYGTSQNPTITSTKITAGTATTVAVDMSATLTGLTPGTAYFVRGYATHEGGTVYGDQATFTTLSLKAPELTTADATDITTAAFSMIGKLTNLGTSNVTQHGHVLSATNQTPTTADTKTEMGAANMVPKDFKSVFTGLKANTTYYVRGYASNATGTGYSEVKTVKTTSEAAPTVSINDATDVAPTSFNITGKVTAIGTADVTQLGHVLSATNQTPTTADTKTEMGGTNAPKDFKSNFGNLAPGKTYYVRAYALNTVGISYSEVKTVKTTDAQPPTVTTGDALDITRTDLSIIGDIKDLGTSDVTQHGHVLSENNQTPTLADVKTELGGANALKGFKSTYNNLKQNTTYYVRAYATNATGGTGYGTVKTVKTTNDTPPTVSTQLASSMGKTNGNFTGLLTSTGTKPVTELGHVWSSSNQTPTVNDAKYTAKTNITTVNNPGYDYISPMANLTPNTTYYVRAYATNSVGTAYGETKTAKTMDQQSPTVTTGSVSSINYTSALGGTTLVAVGTNTNIQLGLCWSKDTQNPTVNDNKTSAGASSPQFFALTMTNLVPGSTYYYRAFATSNDGTGYGDVKSFATPSGLPAVQTLATGSLSPYVQRLAASIDGKLLSFGAATVTAYGHCWSSTNKVPTTADGKNSKNSNPSLVSEYISDLTNLTANTTYYVRGYATNSYGTAYGDVLTFTTQK